MSSFPKQPLSARWGARSWLALAALSGLTSAWAQQQPNPRPDAGTLLRQYELRPTDVPMRRGVMTEEPKPPAPGQAFGESEVRVIPSGFRLTGVKSVDEAEIKKLLAPLTGKRASFEQLQYATDLVTAYYRSKGFITSRAYLPQQSLSATGDPVEIEIAVLEGRYGRVRLENKSRVKDGLLRDLMPIKEGEPVRLAPVERGLLLIEDLPGARVISSTFAPGEAVGESDYIAAIGDEPVVIGQASVDNHGLRVTGRLRAGVQAVWQSPRGIGDALEGNVVTTGEGLTTGRFAYSLLLGAKGWRGTASVSRVEYRLGEEYKGLDYRGTADVLGISASYPLVRERSLNVSFSLGAESKRLSDDGAQGLQKKAGNMISIGLNGDEVDSLGGGGTSAWSYSATFGRIKMLNDIARIYDESNSEGGFSRFNAQVTRLQSLDQIAAGWVLQTMVRSQYAPENLESSEKMPLGGPSGVRAYPQGEAAGDRAALVSVELRRGFSWVSGWSNWMSLFYDAGRSQIHAKPFDGSDNVRSLRGYGLGMGADYSGKYFVSASVAKPVGDEPLDGVEAGRSVRGWIQVGANY